MSNVVASLLPDVVSSLTARLQEVSNHQHYMAVLLSIELSVVTETNMSGDFVSSRK